MTTVLLNLLSSLALAVSGSVTAVVYVNILTQPGMIFDGWAGWLHLQKDRYMTPPSGLSDDALHLYLSRREARADFWLKPILTCVYCVSGQLCFWLSFYVFCRYDNTIHIIFPLLTAGMGIYLAGLFRRVQQNLFPL